MEHGHPCLAQPHRLRAGCGCSFATDGHLHLVPALRLRHHAGGELRLSRCGAGGSSPGPAPAQPGQSGCRAGHSTGVGACWQGWAGKPLPAASLAQWEAVTFLGGVPAHIFLSQIRAEACQEIHSEPVLLLLSVLTQRARLALLPLNPSSGLPHPAHNSMSDSQCPSSSPALLLLSRSPQLCHGPTCRIGGN